MKQADLGLNLSTKRTRKREFLDEMNRVVHLLRRNQGFNGVAFSIGDEDAVYLRGRLPVAAVTEEELDRIIGSLYAYVEQCFRPALRIGFASRFEA